MSNPWKLLVPLLGTLTIIGILEAETHHSRSRLEVSASRPKTPLVRQTGTRRLPASSALPADPPIAADTPAATEIPVSTTLPDPTRLPLDTYHVFVRKNLFSPPPPPLPPPPPPAPAPLPPPAPIVAPVPLPAPEDPLQNLIYTGYTTLEDQIYALVEDSKTQSGTWLAEGDTFQNFTVTHITPERLDLQSGTVTRDLAMTTRYNLTPLARPTPANALPDPGNLTGYRGQIGQSYYFQVTGRASGSIWGSGPYTDDSNLGTAAVHAGRLRDGQAGVVKVTILQGYSQYEGSARNGVTSGNYANWEGSYRID